jgi:hypothetical protein
MLHLYSTARGCSEVAINRILKVCWLWQIMCQSIQNLKTKIATIILKLKMAIFMLKLRYKVCYSLQLVGVRACARARASHNEAVLLRIRWLLDSFFKAWGAQIRSILFRMCGWNYIDCFPSIFTRVGTYNAGLSFALLLFLVLVLSISFQWWCCADI